MVKKPSKTKNLKKKVLEAGPHKSFRRTYREDYLKEDKTPGMMHHIIMSFQLILKNWKLFLPFLIIVVVLNIVLIGLMSESTYVQMQDTLDRNSQEATGEEMSGMTKAGIMLISTITTGGLAGESKEVTMAFSALIFLMIWLVTIFILRHRLAKNNIKLRDALYNAMTPLISTLVLFLIALIQCIPIFLLIIAYSAAVQTDFLSTPFYALMFVAFAALMILLSGYLLSSSIIALVAVTAPGLYPVVALSTASELMMGKRIKFIMRLIALILVIGLMWAVIMIPLILFDMAMKQFEWTAGIPFIPICLVIMTCFTEIYATTYLFLYYRYLLEE
ncbi:hypothetical protein IKD82_01340 [Candidatus Saccharibacteria bacterium]|nr:hypothetical protein [Candidatus Saccharibacteria bacterium]